MGKNCVIFCNLFVGILDSESIFFLQEVGEVCFDDLCQVIQQADTIHFALVELSLEIILDLLGAPPVRIRF